jgi:hypothetical protein
MGLNAEAKTISDGKLAVGPKLPSWGRLARDAIMN